MKTAYLYGHTGSINRGCEAIVRSTSYILKNSGFDKVNLFIGDQSYDKKLGVHEELDFVPLKKNTKLIKALCYICGKKFGWILPSEIKQLPQVKKIAKEDISFAIGGDTYCYGFPHNFAGFNRALQRKNIKNILWGCSVDERVLNSKKHIKDLNNYSHIVVRETLSFEVLKKIIKDENKIYLTCDPAFNLEIKETELPEGFCLGNTIGINLSHMVFTDYKDENDIMRKNITNIINYILNETDMNICFIPHVYDVEENLQDIVVINEFYKKYANNERISVVNKNLSCTELKYIISKCNYFIGARTHSMIAAYSTGVPALALGYSIKARGLAKDLYGDEELVVDYKSVVEENQILTVFKLLINREQELKDKYSKNLDSYKNTIFDAIKQIIEC